MLASKTRGEAKMKKKYRKAVRSFLIEDNNIVAIKYKKGINKDYYDIPGGKIETGETSEEASIREFKEETGMDILKQKCIGHVILEYPDRIYDFDIYVVKKYNGNPTDFENNYSMWKNIDVLINEQNIFASIEIIKYIIKNPKQKIELKIFCDINHKITKIEEM